MNTPTSVLISALENQTKVLISKAEYLLSLNETGLKQRPANGGWNALECMEHLNRYGNFYLPEIRKRITQSPFAPSATFKPGMLGNYFAKSMEPKEGTKKMKTFKDKDPIHTNLGKQCIETFIAQQHDMLALLQSARKVDLNRTKTSISITKLITLKLGDTFRFVINHNERHMAQAMAALPAIKMQKPAAAAGS
jgi:DinB superfamily